MNPLYVRMAKWAAWCLAAVTALTMMLILLNVAQVSTSSVVTARRASVCVLDQVQVVDDGTLTAQEVAALAQQAGFSAEQIPTAVAIARAESGWRPRATNANTDGTNDWGLFQINDVNAAVLATGDKFDPADNAKMAYLIWKSWGNWNAWSTFKSGAYRQFLPDTADAYGDFGCTPAPVAASKCKGGDVSGYPNGKLPTSALCPLWAKSSLMLRSDAAAAFDAMSKAYFEHFGTKPCITDAYRSLAQQIDVRARKPHLAAVPGTSNHGWGVAVDLGCGAEVFGSEVDRWYEANSLRFGWDRPNWADPDGSKPEPWHREWVAGAR